jgi:hypothetical protein
VAGLLGNLVERGVKFVQPRADVSQGGDGLALAGHDVAESPQFSLEWVHLSPEHFTLQPFRDELHIILVVRRRLVAALVRLDVIVQAFQQRAGDKVVAHGRGSC